MVSHIFYFLSRRRRPMKRKKKTSSQKSSLENLPPMKLTGSPMKKKKRSSSLKSSQQQMVEEGTYSYLPDDCWESVFKFIINYDDENNNRHYLNSLSMVSKQFLSIIDRLKSSLTVLYQTLPFLRPLFKRFTNLTSLNLVRLAYYNCDLDTLLCQISRFPSLNITSLKLRYRGTILANGLLAFSQNNITTLTSLTCSHIVLDNIDDLRIGDCFPFLKELNLNHAVIENHTKSMSGICGLLSKCRFIQHLDLSYTDLLNDQQVAELSLLLVDLVSINLSVCGRLTESALFSLVRNCPSLSEIKMECTVIGKKSVGNSNSLRDFIVVSPQLRSLCLALCMKLRDEHIILFSSIFPNLEVLDLSYLKHISLESICQVLKCCKIKHLILSRTNVDDKSLYMISKSCFGLLQLELEHCKNVTENGLKHVVENCKQLREINLRYCDKVHANAVVFMVTSRPSLRKIITSFHLNFSDIEKKIFSRHGCLVY